VLFVSLLCLFFVFGSANGKSLFNKSISSSGHVIKEDIESLRKFTKFIMKIEFQFLAIFFIFSKLATLIKQIKEF